MKLHSLRLRNFRCFQDEIVLKFSDLTTFVGKNDIGKSSIMDALDIFLSDGIPDKHDASKAGDGADLTIACEFSDFPEKAIIDEDAETSFSGEHLLNAQGRLEIHKTFSGHLSAPKCSGVRLACLHPTAEKVADLLQLKNSDLKKRAKDLKVDLTPVDQKINAELRKAIRGSVADLNLRETLIPLNDGNGKSVWEGIKKCLPAFALFKSDRVSSDQDSEAQDPLKTAVKDALKAKEAELAAISSYVEEEVKKVATLTVQMLGEMDATLAKELKPQFSPPKWDSLFKASITGDDDIPINKRGSGVRRLILLNFFRAKAQQQAYGGKASRVIYAVEEPETSQHPNNQRMLIRALMDLAGQDQVILTTHTPMLARTVPDSSLRFITIKKGACRDILCGGHDTNEQFTKALGVLPDNGIRLFIGVEGKHDIAFLTAISKILRASGEAVPDLEQLEQNGELIFFPLGGSNLALWTSKLAQLNRPEFHLYDRDNTPPAAAKYQSSADAVNLRNNCVACITKKKELENYLHWKAVEEAYQSNGTKLVLGGSFADFDDVPALVAERVHTLTSGVIWAALDEQAKDKKVSRAKSVLNGAAALRMTKERLLEVDATGEIISWFQQMEGLMQSVSK